MKVTNRKLFVRLAGIPIAGLMPQLLQRSIAVMMTSKSMSILITLNTQSFLTLMTSTTFSKKQKSVKRAKGNSNGSRQALLNGPESLDDLLPISRRKMKQKPEEFKDIVKDVHYCVFFDDMVVGHQPRI
jgi:hypothetical protein